jgi:HAD superfamily hydrolase (TIGR01509 family)
MIRAIIFDCFGVLTTDAWLPFKEKYFSDNEELFRLATDLNKQADSGLIGYDDFVRGVADLAGISFTDARKTINNNVPNAPLFKHIAQLKPKYKLGILSNASGNWLPDLFAAEQLAAFDATALSYETGVTKPEPRAYETIATRLSAEPEECVFIDDQERFCTAAEDVGMRSVWYQSFDQMKSDLEKILK